MTDLAADLEAAERGSRELSDRVLLALGYDYTLMAATRRDPARSVDDGLALLREMPEWKGWGSISWPGRREGELVNDARVTLHHALSSGGGPRVHGFAKTPALALAAALVRAAETQK